MVDSKKSAEGSPRLRIIAFSTALIGAVGVPVAIIFDSGPRFRSNWLLVAIGAGAALAVGGVFLTARLARSENVSLETSARRMAFAEAFVLTSISWVFTGSRPVPGSEQCQGSGVARFCTQTYKLHTSPAAIALLVSAAALIFLSLVFIPSSERELARRIDLEACGVALPISFFFFVFYEPFQGGLSLPHFTAGIAAWTLLISYLLARLALTIRYR